MKNQLQNYFPMIRTQEEILEEIREKPELWSQYRGRNTWRSVVESGELKCFMIPFLKPS